MPRPRTDAGTAQRDGRLGQVREVGDLTDRAREPAGPRADEDRPTAHAFSRTLVKPPTVRERRGRGIIVREGPVGASIPR